MFFWYRIWFDLFHWKNYSWWRDTFYRYCVGCLRQWLDQLFIFPLDVIFDSLQWCYCIPTYMYLAAGIIEVPVNFTFLRSTCSTNIFTQTIKKKSKFFVVIWNLHRLVQENPALQRPCLTCRLENNHFWIKISREKQFVYGTKSCSRNNAVEIRLAKQLELTNAPTNPSRFSKG